jgi:hypothetical protein
MERVLAEERPRRQDVDDSFAVRRRLDAAELDTTARDDEDGV